MVCLDCIDRFSLNLVLRTLHRSDCAHLLLPVQSEQVVCFNCQLPDAVMGPPLPAECAAKGEALNEEENREAAGLFIIRAQLYHVHQQLHGGFFCTVYRTIYLIYL
jgi:hypothetical protein